MDILSTHYDGHKAHFAMAISPHFASAQMVWGSWWSIQWHYAILWISVGAFQCLKVQQCNRCVKLLIDSRGGGLKHCLFIPRAKGDDPS